MTTEMEERVARALDERISGWFGDRVEATLNTLDLAREAIRAIREPTDAMIDAGTKVTFEDEDRLTDMWQAMIDKASPPREVPE